MVQVDNPDTLDQTKHDLEELSWCTAGMTSNGSAAAENLLGLISAAKKRVISLPSSDEEAIMKELRWPQAFFKLSYLIHYSHKQGRTGIRRSMEVLVGK